MFYVSAELSRGPRVHAFRIEAGDPRIAAVLEVECGDIRGPRDALRELHRAHSLKVANLVAGNASLVRLVEDSSNTFALLQVDIDGAGAEPWVTIARLDGLHGGDVINIMLDETGAVTKFVVGGAAPPPPPPPSVHSDIWLLSNGNWSASVDPGGHPLGSHIAGVGDFNRDGTGDLLWFNPSSMSVDVWKLSNGQWAGSTDGPSKVANTANSRLSTAPATYPSACSLRV
jgi:hypothetical protein